MPNHWLDAEIKVYPYLPSIEYPQSLVCYFNDHVFYNDEIAPDWSIVKGRIDPAWIGRINLLKLEGSSSSSPIDHGNPADTRILSIACDWVRLTSVEKTMHLVTWRADASGFAMDIEDHNDISTSFANGILSENLKNHLPLTLSWIFGIMILITSMLYEPAVK